MAVLQQTHVTVQTSFHSTNIIKKHTIKVTYYIYYIIFFQENKTRTLFHRVKAIIFSVAFVEAVIY